MKNINKITSGFLSLTFILSLTACNEGLTETGASIDINTSKASETTIANTSTSDTAVSDTDSDESESITSETFESESITEDNSLLCSDPTSETVEQSSNFMEQVDDTGALLTQFKALADTINSSNPDAVYSIRHGGMTDCTELPPMDYFLCVYTKNDDTGSVYDAEGNLLYEVENCGGTDYRGYYTYEAFEKSPVIIFSHDLGLGRADNVTFQTVEDYKEDVADGEYFGTVLAVSEDGKQALVSLGKAIVYSQEETESIELDEGYWQEYQDGFIWRMEGDSGYWDTEDRVLSIIDLAPEVKLSGESSFVRFLTGDYQNNYEDSVLITGNDSSILDTKFIEYSIATYTYEYDGWIETSAKAAPIIISDGMIKEMDLFPAASY